MQPSNSIDVSAGLVSQTFENIDEQAECLTGYDQKYQQFSRGRFRGRTMKAQLGPEIEIYFEKLNQVLDQSGAVPQDQYSIIFLMNRDRPCKLNGRDFSSDDLYFGCPGSSYQSLSRAGTHYCVVSIAKKKFEALLVASAGNGLTGYEGLPEGTQKSSPLVARQLRQLADHTVSAFELGSVEPRNTCRMSELSTPLAELVSDYASFDVSTQTPPRPAHQQTVQKARDYIHANARNHISIAHLSSLVGVSRRTLETSFRNCLEQSPAAYLRLVRLNEIRRALLLPDNSHRPIGDIAAEWGVWHLSRFAQYYRHQFGELPSLTRLRTGNA